MYDVIVVGSGPAGSTTAKEIVENSDKDVLILEARDEPLAKCAGGISVHMVEEMGIDVPDEVIEREINEMVIRTFDHRVSFTKEDIGVDKPMGYTLDRFAFDKYLLEQATDMGAELRNNNRVIGVDREEDHWEIQCDNGNIYKTEYLVCADGARGEVGRLAGFVNELDDEEMHVGFQYTMTDVNHEPDKLVLLFTDRYAPGGYLWAFPAEDGLRLGVGIPKSEGSPKKYLNLFLHEHAFFSGGITNPIGGLVPTSLPYQTAKDKVALVGDSARVTSALHGGGIAQAVICAQFLGDTIAKDESLEGYKYKWQNRFYPRLKREYKLKNAIYRKDNEDMDRIIKAIQGYTPDSLNVEAEMKNLAKHLAKNDITLIPKILKEVYR